MSEDQQGGQLDWSEVSEEEKQEMKQRLWGTLVFIQSVLRNNCRVYAEERNELTYNSANGVHQCMFLKDHL